MQGCTSPGNDSAAQHTQSPESDGQVRLSEESGGGCGCLCATMSVFVCGSARAGLFYSIEWLVAWHTSLPLTPCPSRPHALCTAVRGVTVGSALAQQCMSHGTHIPLPHACPGRHAACDLQGRRLTRAGIQCTHTVYIRTEWLRSRLLPHVTHRARATQGCLSRRKGGRRASWQRARGRQRAVACCCPALTCPAASGEGGACSSRARTSTSTSTSSSGRSSAPSAAHLRSWVCW